jgi:Uncharacterized conserved protein (DUF2267)
MKIRRRVGIEEMNDTQVSTLDHTIQQTNVWLKTLAESLHLDERHYAYSALCSVLHVLRDRLTPQQAVHLGAQLPILVRGIYDEGWRLSGRQQTNASRPSSQPSWRPNYRALTLMDCWRFTSGDRLIPDHERSRTEHDG